MKVVGFWQRRKDIHVKEVVKMNEHGKVACASVPKEIERRMA